jgi:heme/copper-type cytochrome/quinol oxidase subunit 2
MRAAHRHQTIKDEGVESSAPEDIAMQNALGLLGNQALMFGITVTLGVAGIVALLMALFWPRRWALKYRLEIVFVALLVGLVVYADVDSANTYKAYEAVLPHAQAAKADATVDRGNFDRSIRVYAFQWGFLFLDEKGEASRNAVKVAPGDRILLTILSNDVIHGLNVPAAGLTTEVEPGDVRRLWMRAPDRPGKYLMQCLNYCGLGHAQMKSWLVVGHDAMDATHG